jgi:hypothetical protein
LVSEIHFVDVLEDGLAQFKTVLATEHLDADKLCSRCSYDPQRPSVLECGFTTHSIRDGEEVRQSNLAHDFRLDRLCCACAPTANPKIAGAVRIIILSVIFIISSPVGSLLLRRDKSNPLVA